MSRSKTRYYGLLKHERRGRDEIAGLLHAVSVRWKTRSSCTNPRARVREAQGCYVIAEDTSGPRRELD